MNIKRGLLRAWVVLSVIWVGLIGLLADPLESWNRAPKFNYDNISLEMPPRASREQAITAIATFIDQRRSSPSGSFADLLPSPKDAATKVVGSYDGYTNHWKVASIAAVAFLPPFVLLCLGLAVGWIWSGFASS